VVDSVSFDVRRGETLGLVGESGSGKSVSCMALTSLIPMPPGRIAGGTVRLGGRDLVGLDPRELESIRGAKVANIFQEPMTSLNPAFTVGEQIAEMVRRHQGKNRTDAWDHAVAMLERVGIPNARLRAREYPHQFSGGMRQRVMIAMALSCDPELLIADEPTTALDVTIQAQVLDLLKEMQAETRMAVIFITHDLGVVANICDRVVVLYGGRVMEEAPIEELYLRPSHPYTEGLLTAMPQLGARSGRLASIPGSPPMPSARPEGCVFAPRCPYAVDRCRTGGIDLVELGRGRFSRCVRTSELELMGTS
jgi:oligopeptide/dipeptide ABC transporter ATP-binding protein